MKLCMVILVLQILVTNLFAQEWTHWSGPYYNCTSPERLAFPDGQIVLPDPAWKFNVGEGCGSIVGSDGFVYVTGWNNDKETVYCLSEKDGLPAWSKSYQSPRYGRYAVGDQEFYSGPMATPTLDPESRFLYTLGCDGDLRCWDTSRQGALVWAVNLYDRYNAGERPNVGGGQRDYGYTTAPLLYGSNLIVAVGGQAGLVIAFDKLTGEHRWASGNHDFAAHCGGISPIIVDDIPCIAALSLKRLVVIRTDRGHEGQTLAEYPWQTNYANNIVTPTVVGSQIILSSVYNYRKTVLLEIMRDSIVNKWESKYCSGVCSPAIYKGKIYLAYQQLYCLDLTDGSLMWKGGHYGPDSSCLVTADGYIIAFSNKRLTIIDSAVRSPNVYKEVATRDSMCEINSAWPQVVYNNSRIYCKDKQGNIYCFYMNG